VPLRWSEALSIGVPEIDAQHRELFRRVEGLLAAMRANDPGVLRLVNYLAGHVEVHFRAEEDLMSRLGYPGVAEHVAEHRAFLDEFERLEHAFAQEGATASLVLRLERWLTAWLAEHVSAMDGLLAAHVRQRGSV
jgi:hemerythrin